MSNFCKIKITRKRYESSQEATNFPSGEVVIKLISSLVLSFFKIQLSIKILSVLTSKVVIFLPTPTNKLEPSAENLALEGISSIKRGSLYCFIEEFSLKSHNLMVLSSEHVTRILLFDSSTSIETIASL